MNDQEAVADIMNKIKIMQEYKDKYGEDDINEYFEIFYKPNLKFHKNQLEINVLQL